MTEVIYFVEINMVCLLINLILIHNIMCQEKRSRAEHFLAGVLFTAAVSYLMQILLHLSIRKIFKVGVTAEWIIGIVYYLSIGVVCYLWIMYLESTLDSFFQKTAGEECWLALH